MKFDPNDLANVAGLSSRFMWFVMFWNHAELVAQQIAQMLLGESAMSMALTAELGNRTLMEAIEVASHELTHKEMGAIGEHLRHFSKGYSQLLGYRNFYVHGIYGTKRVTADASKTEAFLLTFDGKGRARYFNRPLTEADLDTATRAIHTLIGYGAAIQRELGAEGDSIDRLISTYSASLEKPSWPPPVEKTPLYIQGQEPPPPKPSRKRGTR